MELYLRIKALVRNDDGVTNIEYAFVALLIALAVVAAITVIGASLEDAYNDISSAFPAL